MLFAKDRKSGYILDHWRFLGPKRRSLLEKSWAGLFRKEILLKLPVEKMKQFFSSYIGRPTKDLFTVLGVLILQQMHDLTDEETVQQLAFNVQWHYAFDITDESDHATYLCPKTLWSMRKLVTDENLDTVLFENITNTLAKAFGVDVTNQRLDSVHIKSNMRRLGRIGIFSESIHKFLVNLRRQYKRSFKTIPQDIIHRYLSEKSLACFSQVKPSESKKTLNTVSSDLAYLVSRFGDNNCIKGMYSYQLLCRVLEEQCLVTGNAWEKPEVALKPAKEIPSDSLQNPSDPDAGYDGHKGQGYQVQIMETYQGDQEKNDDGKSLNLITHVAVEPAHQSDAQALIPAISSTQRRGLAPTEILADTLYGSDENCETASRMGVEVIAPTMGSSNAKGLTLSDFELSLKNKIIRCPQGHPPCKHKRKKNGYSAVFSYEHCINCPRLSECPIKQGKKNHYLHYDEKSLRLSQRRVWEKSIEFTDRYRFRAGIEAAISEYDRRTNVKRLRVRGLPAVRFCATLKAVAVNIFRATAARNARNEGKESAEAAIFCFYDIICEIKGPFGFILAQIGYLSTPPHDTVYLYSLRYMLFAGSDQKMTA